MSKSGHFGKVFMTCHAVTSCNEIYFAKQILWSAHDGSEGCSPWNIQAGPLMGTVAHLPAKNPRPLFPAPQVQLLPTFTSVRQREERLRIFQHRSRLSLGGTGASHVWGEEIRDKCLNPIFRLILSRHFPRGRKIVKRGGRCFSVHICCAGVKTLRPQTFC